MSEVILSVEQDQINSTLESYIIPIKKDDEIEPHNGSKENDDEIKPHNGKPITRLEVSPNEKYFVTYSEDDHSIVGWDVDKGLDDETNEHSTEVDKGRLKPDITVQTIEINSKYKLNQICVSDDKKLACIYIYDHRNHIKIIDLRKKCKIELYFDRGLYSHYCTFNLENKFILYGNIYEHGNIEKLDGYIWIYSTKGDVKDAKDKKWIWTCEKLHKIPKNFDLVSISKDNKLYLLSNNSIYEWNIVTGKIVGNIFLNEQEKGKDKLKKKDIKDIKISSDDYFICLRFKYKIIIYSIELDIPIASLNIKHDGLQLNNLVNHSGLGRLLPSFSSLFEDNYQTESLKIIQVTTNSVFGILDKNIWNSTLENINFLNYAKKINEEAENENKSNSKKTNEKISNENEDGNKKTIMETSKYDHLNIHLFNPVFYLSHKDLMNFIDYRVFEIEDENEDDEDENYKNGKDGKNENLKECIYIEMPKNMLMDEVKELDTLANEKELNMHINEKVLITEYDKQFIYIKVPMNVPADDKLESKCEDDNNLDDKYEKYRMKESIYIKVPKNILMDDKHEGQDLVGIKIVQTFERDDFSDKWKLKNTEIKDFCKYDKSGNKHDIDDKSKDNFDDNDDKKIAKLEIINVRNLIYMGNEDTDNNDNKGDKDDKIGKKCIYIEMPKSIFVNEVKELSMLMNENTNVNVKYMNDIDDKKEEIKLINVSNQWNLICTEIEKYNKGSLLGIKLFDINNVVILSKIGLFVYYINENTRSIFLSYFYFINYRHIMKYYKKVLKTLPLPNHNSFKLDKWVLYLKDNKESFLKYGAELLIFAIKERKLELVEEIYNKCINYFEEDVNNKMFLGIITSTMPLLDKYYPGLISRYLSITNMIIVYGVEEHQSNNNLHLYSFSPNPQIVNLTKSILWSKYNYKFQNPNVNLTFNMLLAVQFLILPLTLLFSFFSFFSFYILSKFHFVNNIYKCDLFSVIYFYIFDKILITRFSKQKSNFVITFMIPYIKFINYPKDYNWLWDWIKPQPSPFVKTVHCKEIYKTWNGEALINFKWNTYGKYYYALIWIGFIALLGCFITAATLSQEYLTEDTRKNLLIASIILGSIHLSFEIRQIIYDPIKWIYDFWNYLDFVAYLLPIITSIYWLQIDNKSDQIIKLLSFSCLFLDIKFLLFLRAFEYFGVYFAIIISVARQIISFLVILFIILISFAHTFYILLLPKSPYSFNESTFNDDTRNPWNITPKYQVFYENNTSASLFVIQEPDENTNMFIDYGTALFAMYLSLTGDQSALSNWPYKENPEIVILVVLFSLLIVVYLMNLFIGLLNIAIVTDNNRVSYLEQKAKILAEIELFYLLPYQRRWKGWFPEVIYYYADVFKTQEKVKEMISEDKWNPNEFSKMKQDLLDELKIS